MINFTTASLIRLSSLLPIWQNLILAGTRSIGMFHPTTRVQEPLLLFHGDHAPFGRDQAILCSGISQSLKFYYFFLFFRPSPVCLSLSHWIYRILNPLSTLTQKDKVHGADGLERYRLREI